MGNEPGARTRARLDAIVAAANDAEQGMADMRFTAKSSGGLVEAEADHHGSVVALRIDPRALLRGRASEVGAQVVQAITKAVREAEATSAEMFEATATVNRLPLPPWTVR